MQGKLHADPKQVYPETNNKGVPNIKWHYNE